MMKHLKTTLLTLLIACGLILATAKIIDGVARLRSASAMAAGAKSFLAALTPEQRAKTVFDFADEQRYDFHFIPRPRKGLPFKEMDEKQRRLALDFMKTGLSQRGLTKATAIIDLELVLRELEKNPVRRDPELYYFSVFGAPSTKERWGWRVEGHHLSLNYTVVNGQFVATTPAFMGTNPAEVRVEGPRKGLRVLGAEEDIARQLLRALDEKQRGEAIFEQKAFPDIITMVVRKVDPLQPAGVAASSFNEPQKKLLNNLLNEYAATMPADIAAERMGKMRRAGMEKIRFGWAGGIERGDPHYYRVQGPTFLIEYDNTQNNANHAHTVWRDFDGDWGADLLREHYKNSSHHQGQPGKQ
ncbi:MAG: DUF3500 domain-containing protein [Acidobacteriota bacterium]|nr:DUF3500 domain-containing protein [Acidobacteriota bacterium]